MQATLTFKADIPEEEHDLRIRIDALEWQTTVYDLDQWLRTEIKHNDRDYDDVRDHLHNLLEARGLVLD
jgi:hypothetical protein